MTFDEQPLAAKLSGLALEYRIVQLYSRDAGKREAKIGFDVGQGTQDLGFRNEVDDPVRVRAGRAGEAVGARRRRHSRRPGSSSFRDAQGRVYPVAVAAAGAGLLLPRPDLSGRRRRGAAAARASTTSRTPAGRSIVMLKKTITVPGRGRAQRVVPPQAVDQAGRPRLVLGRSSRSRRRLRPLRSADRRRDAGRHDAAHPGRRPQRRLRPLVGAVLVLPEAVLRRAASTSSRRRTT